jgi:DNA-directed RNA polymerase III subunit RPC8
MFILVSPIEATFKTSLCLTTNTQTKIADLVQITPEDFNKAATQAIEDNINAKYANKVIQKIGLCICLYDLLAASEGLIGHGTGLVNVNGLLTYLLKENRADHLTVEFRLIVFRPFKHEVMLGRISSATPQGLRSTSPLSPPPFPIPF